MMEVEELDGGCGLWIFDCCWPKSEPKELSCDANVVTLMTSTVINVDGMDAVCV